MRKTLNFGFHRKDFLKKNARKTSKNFWRAIRNIYPLTVNQRLIQTNVVSCLPWSCWHTYKLWFFQVFSKRFPLKNHRKSPKSSHTSKRIIKPWFHICFIQTSAHYACGSKANEIRGCAQKLFGTIQKTNSERNFQLVFRLTGFQIHKTP